MNDLGMYFSWPLFVIRLVAIVALLPLLIIVSFFLTGKSYVNNKLDGKETSFIKVLLDSFKTVFLNSGLFIIGGRKIIRK